MTDHERGVEAFTEYFVRNYPGPDTVIFDPKWHAPKIFRAAISAYLSTAEPSKPVAEAVKVKPEPVAWQGKLTDGSWKTLDDGVASEILSGHLSTEIRPLYSHPSDEITALRNRCAELEAALRDKFCPRPCNGRPDDFGVGDCVDAGECGCSAAILSPPEATTAPKPFTFADPARQLEHEKHKATCGNNVDKSR